jgi:pyrroline-5-carboxylate reductase
MKNSKIGFIGGGNMAASLIGGMIAGGVDAKNIWVFDVHDERLSHLRERFGINCSEKNLDVVAAAEVIVFAVKPQHIHTVAMELAEAIGRFKPLVISIAAGIREQDLARWLRGNTAIVRTMPNTPALVRCGATALYANKHVSNEQKDLAESIMRAVGLTIWLDDEEQMDAVTALSGSGPAYFFMIMECLEQAASNLGLPPPIAKLLTVETAFGATKMALESPDDVATLRKMVTSPGGTTEAALNKLLEGRLQDLFNNALSAAYKRSQELAQEFGGK